MLKDLQFTGYAYYIEGLFIMLYPLITCIEIIINNDDNENQRSIVFGFKITPSTK